MFDLLQRTYLRMRTRVCTCIVDEAIDIASQPRRRHIVCFLLLHLTRCFFPIMCDVMCVSLKYSHISIDLLILSFEALCSI